VRCRRLGWAEQVVRMEAKKNATKFWFGKRPVGRSRLGMRANFKTDLSETGCADRRYMEPARNRVPWAFY
jgi:hypothetical protein